MSVGIRSGVNWMRLNVRPSALRQRAHQQRLGRARQAGDQAMAADEQRDQQLLDDFVLADDELAHLGADLPEGRLETLDQRSRFLAFELVLCVAQRTTSNKQLLGFPIMRGDFQSIQ